MTKTIILLNLRFSDFYSIELFKRVKQQHNVKFVAVLDQHFKEHVGEHIHPYLDEIHILAAQSKDGFLAEFDFDQLCEIVEREIDYGNEIKIVCTDEFNLLHAGKLRRKYNLTGNTDLDMLPFRDKTEMKTLLQNAGIRVPKFKTLQQDDTFESLANTLGLPFVIKPIDSCGSFGVSIVHNVSEYISAFNAIQNSTASFEAEEFIKGTLYHVDSCTKNNKITFICANEYSCPNNQYTEGHPLGSIPVNDLSLQKSLIDFARKALAILQSNNLVNHMEIFLTEKNELVFLEISARPPGGLVNFTHQINFAINLMDEDFFLQTGLYVELPALEKKENAFWMNFPLIPGKITHLNEPRVKSRLDMTYFRKIGDIISPQECNSIVGKISHGIFYHDDMAILRNDFDTIKQFNLVKIET